jgi:RNA polymerase sigma-70 factor, ECF subfamily
VQLVLVEGMTYREAAEVIGCSEGTVRSRLNRARGILRGSLADHTTDAGAGRVVRFRCAREQGR